jgi:hypothetical protein
LKEVVMSTIPEGRDDVGLPDDVDDEDIPTWQPKEDGDKIAGFVVAMKMLISKFGDKKPYPFLVFDQGDGDYISWHASQTVAKRKLKEVRAQVGDVLVVRYKGEKGTRGYKDFAIKSDRKVEFDWDEIGSDGGDE